MSKRGPTRRETDAQGRELLDPPPMTIDQALAADDPVAEIALRLAHKPIEEMSEPEKVFWAVHYFVSDPIEGSDFLEIVDEFARRYGPEPLRTIIGGPIDEMGERLLEIEDAIRASLLAMATRNRAAFDLLPEPK
jgi:hypothetical protein